MLTNSLGHVIVNIVDGTTFTGARNSDGSVNVFDASGVTTPVGLQHPCGAMNVFPVNGLTLTGRSAPNGATYVVNNSTEYGVYHPCGAMNVTGFTIPNATSFLSTWGPYGMVMDFTDASIAIDDETDVLDYTSIGQVSSTTNTLLGPGSLLTYSAPSPKLTEQSDGFLKFQAHNLFLHSEAHGTSPWTASASGVASSPTRTDNFTAGPNGGQATRIQFSLNGGTASGDISAVSQSVAMLAGAPYTRALWMRSTDGSSSYTLQIQNVDGSAANVTVTGAWQQFTVSGVAPGTVSISLRLRGANGNSNTVDILVSGDHLRRTPSVDTYIATTTAAAYDLPYVYSGGVRQSALWEWTAATNLALRSNDFTNASWTKSNMTTALTATGPDGAANSASTLTATAGNATALQAITSGSSSRVTSVYIKRRTGSGNIDLTQDNGTTWTTQTVTSSWTRVALSAVTSTNPTVGIRIVTSGDAVDVFCFQHETGTVATSPIITYGAAVARAADSPQALLSLFPSIGTAYTLYAKYKPQSASVATTAIRLDDTTANELVSLGNNTSGQGLATVTDSLLVTNATDNSSGLIRITVASTATLTTGQSVSISGVGGVTAANGTWVVTVISGTTFDLVGSTFSGTYTSGGVVSGILTSGTITSAAFHRVAASVEGNDVRFVVNGGAEVQDTSVTLPTLTRLLIGSGGGMELVQLAILPGARTESQLQALGA